MAGLTTSTGDSSAVSTGSASNAAFIASTNPAWVNACASRALARSTNPADTRCPNSIATRVAARSVGTFPKLVNATAAAFSTGPKLIPFTNPPGGTAVVIFPQQAHLRCGSSELRPPRDHLHIPDLRPRRPAVLGLAQLAPAPTTLDRRVQPLPLLRIRIPDQTTPGMPRLPTPLTVLRPLPRGRIGVPARLPRPTLGLTPRLRLDRLLRRRRPRIITASPQPPLQLRDPQIPLSDQLDLSPDLLILPLDPPVLRRPCRTQLRDLGILRLAATPQPRRPWPPRAAVTARSQHEADQPTTDRTLRTCHQIMDAPDPKIKDRAGRVADTTSPDTPQVRPTPEWTPS